MSENLPMQLRRIARHMELLLSFAHGVAAEPCCGTPGCSPDDPKCTTMEARSVLEKVGYNLDWSEV